MTRSTDDHALIGSDSGANFPLIKPSSLQHPTNDFCPHFRKKARISLWNRWLRRVRWCDRDRWLGEVGILLNVFQSVASLFYKARRALKMRSISSALAKFIHKSGAFSRTEASLSNLQTPTVLNEPIPILNPAVDLHSSLNTAVDEQITRYCPPLYHHFISQSTHHSLLSVVSFLLFADWDSHCKLVVALSHRFFLTHPVLAPLKPLLFLYCILFEIWWLQW